MTTNSLPDKGEPDTLFEPCNSVKKNSIDKNYEITVQIKYCIAFRMQWKPRSPSSIAAIAP